MPIQVTRLTEPDIHGAITTIQLAFADDPYNRWVYDDRSKVNYLVFIFILFGNDVLVQSYVSMSAALVDNSTFALSNQIWPWQN